MDKKAEALWGRLNEAWIYYQNYLNSKNKRFYLSVVDLIYISNFKGGNASITEPLEFLTNKLEHYTKTLTLISKEFNERTLSSLNDDDELDSLIQLCNKFLGLTKKNETKIRGFGPSYASALLAAHFPDLIPVLDRHLINGANISAQWTSKKQQVKNIEQHYGELIRKIKKLMKEEKLSLRAIDRLLFIKPIEK